MRAITSWPDNNLGQTTYLPTYEEICHLKTDLQLNTHFCWVATSLYRPCHMTNIQYITNTISAWRF